MSTIAEKLATASNEADFYDTVAIAHGEDGTRVVDGLASDVWLDDEDGNSLTYSVSTPYDVTRTHHALVTYPAASHALQADVVDELIEKAGELTEGQAYALATLEADYYVDNGEGEVVDAITVGYVVILSVVSADALQDQ